MTESIVTTTHSVDELHRQINGQALSIETLRGEIDRIKADAQAKLDAQAADWKKLNELLNQYANDEGLCDAYEDRIDIWNSSLTHFKLTGRRKGFVVKVQVKLQYETEIEVDAINRDSAKEKIDDLDSYDLLEGLSIGDYEDIDYTTLSAREGYL